MESDDPAAAALTEKLGRAMNRVALVVFPVGTVICVLVLLVGSPDRPKQIIWTALLGLLGSAAAVVSWRRRSGTTRD